MHLPATLSGDATADTRTVLGALLGGRATCVYDGVAPASGFRLEREPGGALEAALETPRRRGGRLRLLRDGRELEVQPLPAAGPVRLRFCGGGCSPGSYRLEGTVDGRPWIFANPVAIE